jgi:hypothetical protein
MPVPSFVFGRFCFPISLFHHAGLLHVSEPY